LASVPDRPWCSSGAGRLRGIVETPDDDGAVTTLVGVVSGLAAWVAGAPVIADTFWAATTALLLVPLSLAVVGSL
jgi:hypothetical protein